MFKFRFNSFAFIVFFSVRCAFKMKMYFKCINYMWFSMRVFVITNPRKDAALASIVFNPLFFNFDCKLQTSSKACKICSSYHNYSPRLNR